MNFKLKMVRESYEAILWEWRINTLFNSIKDGIEDHLDLIKLVRILFFSDLSKHESELSKLRLSLQLSRQYPRCLLHQVSVECPHLHRMLVVEHLSSTFSLLSTLDKAEKCLSPRYQ